MNARVSPVVAAIAIALVVAAAAVYLYKQAGFGEPMYGARMPAVVLKEFREKGPRPMGPMPMPGGGAVAPQGGAVGKPAKK